MNESKGKRAAGNGLTLKDVAPHAGCTASTVSAVLNNSPAANVISRETKERVLSAARELNYQPNFAARSLRIKRSYTVGVITEEIGDPLIQQLVDLEDLNKDKRQIHPEDLLLRLLQFFAEIRFFGGRHGK